MTDETKSEGRLRWDGTVTAGNVLAAAAMLVALLGWGLRLEGRVDMQQQQMQQQHQSQQQRTDAQAARILLIESQNAGDNREIALLRESLADSKASSASVLYTVRRLEAAMDADKTRR